PAIVAELRRPAHRQSPVSISSPLRRNLNKVQPVKETRRHCREGLEQRGAGSKEIGDLTLGGYSHRCGDSRATEKRRIAEEAVRINQVWRRRRLLHREKRRIDRSLDISVQHSRRVL